MNKFQKSLFPFFLVIILFCMTFLTGCAENEDLPASKWLAVSEASGYLYNQNTNRDEKIDITKKGFTSETFSNEKEWDTPLLRYKSIFFDVKTECNILGIAFEIKTDTSEGFKVRIEVQLYKEISLPSNWEELTEEAKMLWEKENRIKDRQYDSIYAGKRVDAFSISFSEGKTKLDDSYQIRIYFYTTEDNISDTEETEDTDYFKNFMVDNFIVLTEGVE